MGEQKTEGQPVKTRVIILLNRFNEPGVDQSCLNQKTLLADSDEFYDTQKRAVERSFNRFSGGFHKVVHFLEKEQVFLDRITVDSFEVYCPIGMNELIYMADNYVLTENDILRFFPEVAAASPIPVSPSSEELALICELADDITDSVNCLPGDKPTELELN